MRMRVDERSFTDQLRRAINPQELTNAVRNEIRKGAIRVQGDVVDSMTPGDVPSKPGEPPRVDTGRLKQSTRVEPTEGGADVVVATNYAVHLEYGTRNMAPRPFLEPAAERNADELAEAVGRAMGRAWED